MVIEVLQLNVIAAKKFVLYTVKKDKIKIPYQLLSPSQDLYQ